LDFQPKLSAEAETGKQCYQECQRFRLNLDSCSEIIISKSLLTIFEANSTFEAAGAVDKKLALA